jgi:hypothetical protein
MIDYYSTGSFRPELLALTTDELVNRILKKKGERKPRKARIDYAKVKELYGQGLTDYAIGAELHVKSFSIGRWRKKNNLPQNPSKHSKKKPLRTANP